MKGDGKVGFSETPKNLPKMDIIEKYLLGGSIFENKCLMLRSQLKSTSVIPFGILSWLPIRWQSQIEPKWSGKLMLAVTRWLKFDSETFLGFHPEKIQSWF